MKLRPLFVKEVNDALKEPKRPDKRVDMQMVKDTINNFFSSTGMCKNSSSIRKKCEILMALLMHSKNILARKNFPAHLFKEGGESFLETTAFRFPK